MKNQTKAEYYNINSVTLIVPFIFMQLYSKFMVEKQTKVVNPS